MEWTSPFDFSKDHDQRDGLVDKGSCCGIPRPEFDPLGHTRQKERSDILTLSSNLSVFTVYCVGLCVIHAHIHTLAQKISKWKTLNNSW